MQTTAKAIGALFPTFNTAITVRKPFDVLTMIEGENSFTGTDAQGNHYDALKVYWRFVPAQAPAVWDGEGRPPVGTVCEAQIPSKQYAWERCEIVWHHPDSDGSAAVVHGDGKLLSWSGTFRPIRTPEQIAAEEREEARTFALNAMTGKPMNPETEEQWQYRLKVVGEMLDLGFRVPKKVSP